jgi:hypothetical protein
MVNNKFPMEVFPKSFQALIEHLKRVSGFDTNLSALSFLSASATYIGGSVDLDNGTYISKPILWCLQVARSGISKSHITDVPFSLLKSIENKNWEEYKSQLNSPELEGQPKEPPCTILIDATMESVYMAHQLNPRGIVLFKDELTAWLRDFNKYNNGGGEKDTLLTLFDGKQLKVHRVSKNTIHLSGTCINIVTGVQPERLNYLMSDENLVSGFYHRFLPSRVAEDVPLLQSTEKIDKSLIDSANIIFQSLYELERKTLKVSDDVINKYIQWQNEKSIYYFKNPFGERLQSKLQTYVWRFCIILDLLDQISTNDVREIISLETMEKAILLAEYFREESTSIYQDSFAENILENEPEAFQSIYKKLEDREYSYKELVEILSPVWQRDNINKKLAKKELFLKIRRGTYIKTIRDGQK